jgi:hypothetical protein
MFKRNRILGFFLILTALCASTANAQVQIPVNPGTVDECVDQSIIFPGLPFDLVFTDNKTLTLGPGTLTFVLQGSGVIFEGALLDAAGDEISGTEYSGLAEGDATQVPLSQSTTWHGMRFVSDFPIGPAGLVFTSCPVVGLAEPAAEAAGFVNKIVTCPRQGFLLAPAGDAIEIDDVIVSSDDATDVEIFFSPPKFLVMKLYLDANESVSTNLPGQLQGEKDQGLKMSCGGVATVSVTIAGSRVGL